MNKFEIVLYLIFIAMMLTINFEIEGLEKEREESTRVESYQSVN